MTMTENTTADDELVEEDERDRRIASLEERVNDLEAMLAAAGAFLLEVGDRAG